MAKPEDGGLFDAAERLGGAAVAAVQSGAAEEAAVAALDAGADALTAAIDGVAEQLQNLAADGVTEKEIRQAYTEFGGVSGVVSLASSAGMTLTAGAVEGIFNAAVGGGKDPYKTLYAQLFNTKAAAAATPEEEAPEAEPPEGFDLWAIINSDDPGKAISNYLSSFLDSFEKFVPTIQSAFNSFKVPFDIAGLFESVKTTIASFISGFGGAEPRTQLAEGDEEPPEPEVVVESRGPGQGRLAQTEASGPFQTAAADPGPAGSQQRQPAPTPDPLG